VARYESEQRTSILNAAVKVFAAKGWKGATVRALGRAARINSALIYYYFENKHTLFVECIQMVLKGFLGHLKERQRPFRSARDRLGFLVDGVIDYYTVHPDRMRLMLLAFGMHPDLMGRAITAIAREEPLVPLQVIQEGMERGELARMHPIHAWWSITGLCLFNLHVKEIVPFMAGDRLPIPPFDLEERRKQIVDLLVDGWALKGTRKE
jgi:TetR/AcrR family transcriptional regulator